MTVRTPQLTLFASTIATGLGFSVVTTSLGASSTAANYTIPFVVGAAMLLVGQAVFVATASREIHRDRAAISLVVAAFFAGVVSVWVWLGPAQTGFLAAACANDRFGACERLEQEGGLAAQVAHGNDDFVVHMCEIAKDARHCRLAAAKRISHPTKFCRALDQSEAFEVVEWCTLNRDGDLLVARR